MSSNLSFTHLKCCSQKPLIRFLISALSFEHASFEFERCDASVLALILEHCASHELEKDKTALKNANAKTIKGKRRIRQLSCLAVNA